MRTHKHIYAFLIVALCIFKGQSQIIGIDTVEFKGKQFSKNHDNDKFYSTISIKLYPDSTFIILHCSIKSKKKVNKFKNKDCRETNGYWIKNGKGIHTSLIKDSLETSNFADYKVFMNHLIHHYKKFTKEEKKRFEETKNERFNKIFGSKEIKRFKKVKITSP